MSIERQAMRGRQAERKLQIMDKVTEIAALSGAVRAYLAIDILVRDQEFEKAKAMMDRWYRLHQERAALQAAFDEAERELA